MSCMTMGFLLILALILLPYLKPDSEAKTS